MRKRSCHLVNDALRATTRARYGLSSPMPDESTRDRAATIADCGSSRRLAIMIASPTGKSERARTGPLRSRSEIEAGRQRVPSRRQTPQQRLGCQPEIHQDSVGYGTESTSSTVRSSCSIEPRRHSAAISASYAPSRPGRLVRRRH